MRTKIFIIIAILLASAAFGFFRWQIRIEVTSGGTGNFLTFGADSSATDGFDIGIDIPYLPTPGPYGYFPISDSAQPHYTMLGTDLRFPSLDTISWDLMLNGGFGFKILWEREEFPDSGDFFIGAFNLDSLPEYVVDDWVNMRTADSLMINVIGGRIIAVGSPISAVAEDALRPESPGLSVHPNPFNTACRVEVPANFRGEIGVFDISGRLVDVLSGDYIWKGFSGHGEKMPSGIYYFKPINGGVPPTRGVMLK